MTGRTRHALRFSLCALLCAGAAIAGADPLAPDPGGFQPPVMPPERPVATSRDGRLNAYFRDHGWPIISITDARTGAPVVEIRHGIRTTRRRVDSFVSGVGTGAADLVTLGLFSLIRDQCGESNGSPTATAAFSPTADRLAIVYEGRIRIFDVKSGRRVGSATFEPYDVARITYSDDGATLVATLLHVSDHSHAHAVFDGTSAVPLSAKRHRKR